MLIFYSHTQYQNVTMVCLEAYDNFSKRQNAQCSKVYRSKMPCPLASTVLHYAQWAVLRPDFPCEQCLNAAREKWRVSYEKEVIQWNNQLWALADPNAMELCV